MAIGQHSLHLGKRLRLHTRTPANNLREWSSMLVFICRNSQMLFDISPGRGRRTGSEGNMEHI